MPGAWNTRSTTPSFGCSLQSFGQTEEFSHGMHLHFLHHAGAMDLDGLFHGAEIVGDLLVQLSGDYVGHDFALAGRHRCQPYLDVIQFVAGLTRDAVLLEGRVNGFDQIVVIHGLDEEIDPQKVLPIATTKVTP